MKNKAPRKKPAVNRVYYIYVGILAVLFFKNAVEKKPQCALYIAIEDEVMN